ncbi:MAG: gliding motility-associated C-terminal domain-containing protein [Bacteroidaceae bacterium]|nr:gliding motility-associated C-terminal domain-containing protein [Bacteroidaceae bacterium]
MLDRKTICSLMLGICCCMALKAQVASPEVEILEENGAAVTEETLLYPSDSYTASAPLRVSFKANAQEQEGYTYAYEWLLYATDTPETPLLRRYEPETEYTFYDSGTFSAKLFVTYTNIESGGEPMTEESEPVTIVISESSLKVPNAFSPNGDGVNDIFKVTYKSLIKFEANIFNRWGQRMYSWNLSNIDAGWDGTHGGNQVKDGVYFIVIEAVGSDGIKYEIKQDINILRGQGGLGVGNISGQ